MGFPRQEYWSGLPFPSPGDLPDPGIEPFSPALAGRFFTAEPPGKPFRGAPETLPLEPCYSDACLSTSLDALGRKFYPWLRRRPEGPVDGNCPHRVVGSLWIWLGKPLSQSVKSWHPFPMFIHQLACLSNDIKLVCVWGSFLHLTIQTCDCHSFGTGRDDRLV